jgi:hypothetical protein
LIPVARLAANTITIRKPKYARGEESVMTTAEKAKTVNTTELSNSENVMRRG